MKEEVISKPRLCMGGPRPVVAGGFHAAPALLRSRRGATLPYGRDGIRPSRSDRVARGRRPSRGAVARGRARPSRTVATGRDPPVTAHILRERYILGGARPVAPVIARVLQLPQYALGKAFSPSRFMRSISSRNVRSRSSCRFRFRSLNVSGPRNSTA